MVTNYVTPFLIFKLAVYKITTKKSKLSNGLDPLNVFLSLLPCLLIYNTCKQTFIVLYLLIHNTCKQTSIVLYLLIYNTCKQTSIVLYLLIYNTCKQTSIVLYLLIHNICKQTYASLLYGPWHLT